MRHKGYLALAIVLLLTLASPVQAATPKAGAKCTKAGITASSGGKKFTCIKSGTKLVWNKGVTLKTSAKPDLNPVLKPAAPTPTPTPSATQTPAPTPTVVQLFRNNGPQNAEAYEAIQPVYKLLNQVSVELAARAQSVRKANIV